MYKSWKIVLQISGPESFYDNKEWSFNPKVDKSLFEQFEKPDIDLFVSRLNTKCFKLTSCKPDPNAYQVNAFCVLVNF